MRVSCQSFWDDSYINNWPGLAWTELNSIANMNAHKKQNICIWSESSSITIGWSFVHHQFQFVCIITRNSIQSWVSAYSNQLCVKPYRPFVVHTFDSFRSDLHLFTSLLSIKSRTGTTYFAYKCALIAVARSSPIWLVWENELKFCACSFSCWQCALSVIFVVFTLCCHIYCGVAFIVVGRQHCHSTMMNVRRFYHLQFVANQRVTNYNSLAIFIIK